MRSWGTLKTRGKWTVYILVLHSIHHCFLQHKYHKKRNSLFAYFFLLLLPGPCVFLIKLLWIEHSLNSDFWTLLLFHFSVLGSDVWSHRLFFSACHSEHYSIFCISCYLYQTMFFGWFWSGFFSVLRAYITVKTWHSNEIISLCSLSLLWYVYCLIRSFTAWQCSITSFAKVIFNAAMRSWFL